MSEVLSFKADAAIITRLGRELVAKQETALIELVKNGFDADATRVDVVFHDSGSGPDSIEIRDNGLGMSRQELVDGFMRLAGDLKVQSPRSPQFGRRRAGRKGIGRFATQRLGDRLVLTTCAARAQSGLRLTVDWMKFTRGRRLEDVHVSLEEVPDCDVGTRIRIDSLRDSWNTAQIRRCWRGVLALQQPFPVRPIESRLRADPGFEVKFLLSGSLFDDEEIVANMQTEILDHLHAVIELEVDDDGVAQWRLAKNSLGPTQDWKRIHHKHRDNLSPPPYQYLRRAAMKAYYAILDSSLLPSLVYTRIRDVLSQEGGIRLYRNDFRVVPYGEPDNDWLGLDAAYVKRAALAPIANRNFFGVVELNDPEGTLFEEHTSREGLIESPAFLELQGLATSVLITAATQIAHDRGRKTHAGRSGGRPTVDANSRLDELSAAVRQTKEAAERVATSNSSVDADAAVKRASETLKLLEEHREEIEASKAQLADEAAMLRFLATLGMTTAEFTHETGMTFDAFRMDFARVFEIAREAGGSDPEFMEKASRAQAMLRRLETLTSYLNTLAAARSLRGMHPVSLSKALEDFERGLRSQALSQSIELVVETPPYDALFTRPMHQAEIASILLNFYTNSLKAMKRSSVNRRIHVAATRDQDGEVSIRFADTGDGIPEQNRERIFDAFFTTTVAPSFGSSDMENASGTGLGLWIVRQIAENAGGRVSVLDPSPGFSTMIEVVFPAEDESNA